jgi:hypothetical protein
MTLRVRGAVGLFAVCMLFAAACVSEPGIDKQKFSELIRTTQDIKTAIAAPDSCSVSDALRQRLADNIAALKDKSNGKAERDLLVAYASLLATCDDGLLLCRLRHQLTTFPFVPKGIIYVTQELDPIVEKYGLATERHQYKPTGQYWRSIDGNSISSIWERARGQIRNIENMVNYG